MIRFTKMQATGNDYVVIEDRKGTITAPGELALATCNRHFGIGADGLILILKSERADLRMRIFNSDGSEAEMCGNGIRCFSKYAYDHGLVKVKSITVETMGGLRTVELSLTGGVVASATVAMGAPELLRERIPMLGKTGTVINEPLELSDGIRFEITAVSMGNPHAVIFVEDTERFPLEKYGPMIENHHLFPNKTNVEFVKVENDRTVVQRTWERGVGETLSCGTGASAVTVAAILNKMTQRAITVRLLGGELTTEWRESDDQVYLTGPASEVFQGDWQER